MNRFGNRVSSGERTTLLMREKLNKEQTKHWKKKKKRIPVNLSSLFGGKWLVSISRTTLIGVIPLYYTHIFMQTSPITSKIQNWSAIIACLCCWFLWHSKQLVRAWESNRPLPTKEPLVFSPFTFYVCYYTGKVGKHCTRL